MTVRAHDRNGRVVVILMAIETLGEWACLSFLWHKGTVVTVATFMCKIALALVVVILLTLARQSLSDQWSITFDGRPSVPSPCRRGPLA